MTHVALCAVAAAGVLAWTVSGQARAPMAPAQRVEPAPAAALVPQAAHAQLTQARAVQGQAVPPQAVQPQPAQAQTAQGRAPADGTTAFLDRYCVSCHNDRARSGGLSLQGAALGPANAEVSEAVLRKLGARQMPPAGAPRPDDTTLDGFVGTLEARMDSVVPTLPPGAPGVHRLNRAEYVNAIRDLLALDIDGAALLPPDETSFGFDNIADALGITPSLLERYLGAAATVSALAVGDVTSRPVARTYVARGDSHQRAHIEGLPLGTRGGLLIDETIPLDAEYEISARLYRTNNGFTRGLAFAHEVEFNVDGERVLATTVGGADDWLTLLTTPGEGADRVDARLRVRVPLKAGPRRIGVTFVEKTGARNQAFFRPLNGTADVVDSDGVPRIDGVTITGPYNVTGPGDTPSRRRIFTCQPAATQDEAACARQIVSSLARQAFRRPVAPDDLEHLLGYFTDGRAASGTFDGGVQLALRRILADPAFLFRVEQEPAGVRPGQAYAVDDLALASRLSFFLWSSLPDEELLALAGANRLHEEPVLLAQTRRMLADRRSAAFVENFAGQWLQLRNLQRVAPDPMIFPDFDDDLRQAFRRETELLVDSIVREDRSIVDLLRADYTFVNERLARHYGIPGVTGTAFRRVPVSNPVRQGLLGHGSMLTVTSHPNRTSPVKRGKWVLEQLLGAPPPPPPPNVPPLDEDDTASGPRTMKVRMESHRRNPACANCHRLMDPVGLALENFDGVGRWRPREAGLPIDASTELSDGTPIDGVIDLRTALLARSDGFVRTFTENLLTYALGRGLTAGDMPAVRTILRGAAANDHRLSALVAGVVTSVPFRMRTPAVPAASPATTVATRTTVASSPGGR